MTALRLLKAYDEEGDYMLFHEEPTSFVDLKPGQFATCGQKTHMRHLLARARSAS